MYGRGEMMFMRKLVVLCLCLSLLLVGCKGEQAVEIKEPSEKPTLEELVKVFKDVDTKYYVT